MGLMRWLVAAGLLCLTACGGGGSSSNSGASNQPPIIAIALTPSSLTGPVLQGISRTLNLFARVKGTFPGSGEAFVVLTDPDGVIRSLDAALATVSADNFTISLVTTPSLAAGEHKGVLTVNVCSAADCTDVYGTITLPYDFTVESATNLTALSPLAGAHDWQTERGDNAHDNYEPVTLDATKFTPRWLLSKLNLNTYPSVGLAAVAPVTDSANHALVTQTATGLAKFDEIDGKEVWSITPTDGSPGALALYSGIIYTGVNGASNPGSFEAFAESNGSVVFDTALSGCGAPSPACTPGAPVVVGSTRFIMPGNGALPVQAFDAAGTAVWTGPSVSGAPGTSPAADSTDLYFYEPNTYSPGVAGTPGFSVLDQATGSLQWQVTRTADPSNAQSFIGLPGLSPALDGVGGAVVNLGVSGDLGAPIDRFDLTHTDLIWEADLSNAAVFGGVYRAQPDGIAVGNGQVYAATVGQSVDALNLNTGAVQWSWQPLFVGIMNEESILCVLATKNLLFVGTNQTVYAVDLNTHQTVWLYPMPGLSLSLSPSGILYIGTEYTDSHNNVSPALAAVNLH